MTTSIREPSADARTEEYERRLAGLWERNLGVPSRSDEDYFRQGGDSLRGTQLISWIYQDFAVELSLLDLFETRTIATQARLLLARQNTAAPAAGKSTAEYGFFGPQHARLFGAFHHPGAQRGNAGVVLCYPMGQEYMRIHRTYVELARSLAGSGRHVLRFDYFGCGDSAGDTTAGSFEQWTGDIHHAVQELRDRTGVRDVYLVGARIGANLVLRACTVGGIAGIVLWEPIVNGVDYIAALQRAHRDLLAGNAALDGYEERRQPQDCMELVGFPVTRRLYDEVLVIDLLADAATGAAPDTLVLANSPKPGLAEYVTARSNGHMRPDFLAVDESDGIWLKEDRQNKGLVPVRAVQAIVSWISGRPHD